MTRVAQQMTAALVRQLGGEDNINIGLLPVPSCGAQQVLIKVAALAVNHVDTFVRSGAYPTSLPMPFIVGRDCVGQVVEVGEGVSEFALGDRVWCNSLGYDGRQGCFAEYALAPKERVYKLPNNVTDLAGAVSLLHPSATAYLGLFREARLQAGDTVFVGGAGGGVGSAIVQLAHGAGARVIASTSAQDKSWVASCGADKILDYHDADLWQQVAQATPQGIDVFWDNSGQHHFKQTLDLLAQGGRIIVTAGLNALAELPIGDLYTKDASIHGFAISNASVADLALAAKAVNQALAKDVLKTRIAYRLPLAETAQAHRLQTGHKDQKVPGRIVVLLD